ncbi:MAG: hypothetical protein HYZ57_21575 [Acidobacteria bacterium]|nr:hypothetical protein [Acidobacteriota bacterium]MBI3282417.1 hypothetical protein [Acidobacteriota bacterium]
MRLPFAAAGTPTGPVADLPRLNNAVPNGRRVFDDVTDIAISIFVDLFQTFGYNIHCAAGAERPLPAHIGRSRPVEEVCAE